MTTDSIENSGSELLSKETITIYSASLEAMDTVLVRIESSFTRGFSGLQLIGNASEVCKDGKERAKAALEKIGIYLPAKRLVVSLTPADLKKDGNHFDLPIAIGLALLVKKMTLGIDPTRWIFAAELGLSGELRPVKGIISFTIAAVAEGREGIVMSRDNLPEVAALCRLLSSEIKKIKVLAFSSLKEVIEWMMSPGRAANVLEQTGQAIEPGFDMIRGDPNFDDMILSQDTKRAAMAACVGMHSLLLQGTPGTGKSMFAVRLSSIMASLEKKEHVEALKIHSANLDRIPFSLLSGRPPFRAPHHQATSAAILGKTDVPGELSLAHGGVLFLDEFPEFRRDVLEALREPLETAEIRVSRADKKVLWQAKMILIAACNNCPCGWLGSKRRHCICTTQQIISYRKKLSGPILERIDIHLNMQEIPGSKTEIITKMMDERKRITTNMKDLVVRAGAFAKERNKKFGVEFNRDLGGSDLLTASGLEKGEFTGIVDRAIPQNISGRSVVRTLRVARSLADLDLSEKIRLEHVKQAFSWHYESAARERGEEVMGMM